MALGKYDLEVVVSAIDRATGPLKKMGAKIKGELGAAGKAGDQARERLARVGSSATQMGTSVLAAGAAVTAGLGAAVKAGMDFQAGMGEVSTLVDTAVVSMSGLETGVRALATETGQSAQVLTQGLYQTISAGVEAGKAVTFLGVAAKAAVGGVTDTATAVDGMTTVMNAWGKSAEDAEEIADSMFIAVKAGKTTIGELSGAYAYIAGTAANAGLSIDETNAALAAMTTQGLKTTMGARSLNMALINIMTPSKDAADAAQELGVELSETALREKGLIGVMEEMSEATGGSVEQMARLLGSSEAARAGLALTGAGGVKFAETLEMMGEKAGASGEAYEKMAATGAQSFARMKASVTELALSISDALEPAVTALVGALKPAVDWLAAIAKTPLGKWGLIAAGGVGALLTVVGGGLIVLGQFAGALRNIGEISAMVKGTEGLGGLMKTTDIMIGKFGSLKGVALGAGSGLMSLGASAWKFLVSPAGVIVAAIAGITIGIGLLRDMAADAHTNLKSMNEEIGITQSKGMPGVEGATPEEQKRMQLTQQIEELNKKRAQIRGILDQSRTFGVMTSVGREIGGTEGIKAYEQHYRDIGKQRDVLLAQRKAVGTGVEKRAGGGPVAAGQPYIVGEKGPEMFVPKQSGMIATTVEGYAQTMTAGSMTAPARAAAQASPASLVRDFMGALQKTRFTGAAGQPVQTQVAQQQPRDRAQSEYRDMARQAMMLAVRRSAAGQDLQTEPATLQPRGMGQVGDRPLVVNVYIGDEKLREISRREASDVLDMQLAAV